MKNFKYYFLSLVLCAAVLLGGYRLLAGSLVDLNNPTNWAAGMWLALPVPFLLLISIFLSVILAKFYIKRHINK